ncbi:MAG: molybdopterin-guanine dinucleotide biosynthesis protein B [Candidatus Firestonebacteria bacterium]
MIPIISFVGKSNSGKTTLLEKIIPQLKKRGYKIGAIKHDVHHFEMDYKGKDTWRINKAGAQTTIIASHNKMAMIKNLTSEYKVSKISKELLTDVDIIITEGYKKESNPKIEVTRSGELLCTKNDNLIAIVNNTGKKLYLKDNFKTIPCFTFHQPKKLVDLIEKQFLKKP